MDMLQFNSKLDNCKATYNLKGHASDTKEVYDAGAVTAFLTLLATKAEGMAGVDRRSLCGDIAAVLRVVESLSPYLEVEELYGPVLAVCANGTVTHYSHPKYKDCVEEIIVGKRTKVSQVILGFIFSSDEMAAVPDTYVAYHHVLRFALFCNWRHYAEYPRGEDDRILVFYELGEAPLSEVESSGTRSSVATSYDTARSSVGSAASGSALKRCLQGPPATDKKRVRFDVPESTAVSTAALSSASSSSSSSTSAAAGQRQVLDTKSIRVEPFGLRTPPRELIEREMLDICDAFLQMKVWHYVDDVVLTFPSFMKDE
jgi:hypothetical protein